MTAKEFRAVCDFEKALAPGAPVLACWTTSYFAFVANATVVRVNGKSVRVALTEEVTACTGGKYPVGHELTIPLVLSFKTWGPNNCVMPPGGYERV